jgi:glyoxylase-like metal-dependent hydrolase (beta-lactamase superfamily II)
MNPPRRAVNYDRITATIDIRGTNVCRTEAHMDKNLPEVPARGTHHGCTLLPGHLCAPQGAAGQNRPGISHLDDLDEGDTLSDFGFDARVLSMPGHSMAP